MFTKLCGLALGAGLLLGAVSPVHAADEEVTLTGALQCNEMCLTDPKPSDQVIVMVAVDGSPSIQDQVKKLMDDLYPDKGLDADAAEKLNDAFDKQMKYFIAPDSPTAIPPVLPKPGPKHYCHSAYPYSITGTISEHDGKKWIKVSSYKELSWNTVPYPAKMMAPDKPFVMPGKPLVVKINDTLSLNCINVPPGKLFMDEEEFVATRYLEQFPHMVTLTKPVYISEIPITQEIWEAVMGNNPSKEKNPQIPVQNPSNVDVAKFLQIMSDKAGHKVRLPTGAEWEYIARSGTSNPGFFQKYRDQGDFKDTGKKVPAVVKTHKPNAWGFYDLYSPWWELCADGECYPARKPQTDPLEPMNPKGNHMLLGLTGENWTVTEREFQKSVGGYTSMKFRIAVESDDKP